MGVLMLLNLILLISLNVSAQQNISQEEVSTATNELISILQQTKYFDFIESRIHGWPESAPQYPWWGNYWSGVTVKKEQGKVSYVHNADGSDNNGLRTAPLMEGACYAYLLSKNPEFEKLTRNMIRGMSGWVLSSLVNRSDVEPKVLNRAFYPQSILSTDNNREIYFNYDASRPGKTNSATQFVRIPDNPYYGDIYIKNQRSSDDIGHIIRSLNVTEATCYNEMLEARGDFDQAIELYARWGKDVDESGFRIPTLDKNLKYSSTENVSVAYTYSILGTNPFCVGPFAIRLLHKDSVGDINCGTGISWMENMLRAFLKNDAFETLRAHHMAAVTMAKKRGLQEQTKELMRGLKKRVAQDFTDVLSDNPPNRYNKRDIPMFFISAVNMGVSLTTEQIKWLHQKLHQTYLHYNKVVEQPVFNVFNSSVPDGEYSYDAPEAEDGIYFRALGLLLGSCVSPYRDPSAQSILDCELLKSHLTIN